MVAWNSLVIIVILINVLLIVVTLITTRIIVTRSSWLLYTLPRSSLSLTHCHLIVITLILILSLSSTLSLSSLSLIIVTLIVAHLSTFAPRFIGREQVGIRETFQEELFKYSPVYKGIVVAFGKSTLLTGNFWVRKSAEYFLPFIIVSHQSSCINCIIAYHQCRPASSFIIFSWEHFLIFNLRHYRQCAIFRARLALGFPQSGNGCLFLQVSLRPILEKTSPFR